MNPARTILTWIDDDEAVRRLALLVDTFNHDPDPSMSAIRRSDRYASFTELDAGATITYDLVIGPGTTPSGDHATAITVELTDVRWRGLSVPFARRLSRPIELLATGLTSWFTVDDPLNPDDPELHQLRKDQDRIVEQIEAALEAPVAVEAPGLGRKVRLRSIAARSIGAAAILAAGIFVVGMVIDTNTENRIDREGVRTTAVIRSLPSVDDDYLRLEVEIDGKRERLAYYDPSDSYEVGQRVRVTVLPGEGQFRLGDEIFMGNVSSDVVGFGAVVTLFLAPLALVVGIRSPSLARGLRAGPFRKVSVTRYRLRSSRRQGLVEIDDGSAAGPRVLRLRANLVGNVTGPDPWEAVTLTGTLLVTGQPGDERAAWARQGAALQVVRTRLPFRRAMWERRLDRRSETPVDSIDP